MRSTKMVSTALILAVMGLGSATFPQGAVADSDDFWDMMNPAYWMGLDDDDDDWKYWAYGPGSYGGWGGPYGWGRPYGWGGPYGWGAPYGGWGAPGYQGYPRVGASQVSATQAAPAPRLPE